MDSSTCPRYGKKQMQFLGQRFPYILILLFKGVRVEPNMGFGRIFPKETIPLFVLYSPVLEHIEGNDAGLQGAEGRHHFSICVTSIAELGRFKSLEETTTQISERETVNFKV